MSTPAEIEKVADKWYHRLDKKPIVIILLLSLAQNVWKEVNAYKTEAKHQEALNKKDVFIQMKEADNKELMRENVRLLQQTADAQRQTIQVLISDQVKKETRK